jgi:hypothetical protein
MGAAEDWEQELEDLSLLQEIRRQERVSVKQVSYIVTEVA